jgi:YD repeat-containing protein
MKHPILITLTLLITSLLAATPGLGQGSNSGKLQGGFTRGQDRSSVGLTRHPRARIDVEPAEAPHAAPGVSGSVGQPALHRCGPMSSVYLFSGEAYQEEVDLHIKGRGIDFVWARKYRSKLGPDTEMGKGWDHSYNVRVRQSGKNLRLMDGNTRSDVFRKQPDGTFARPGFFLVGNENPDGTYTFIFPDLGRWEFHALDQSPKAGRIAAIVGRNDNTLAFTYDGGGRLVGVTDTLKRNVTIGYGKDGFIDTVTDFTGRTVQYDHYSKGDVGGSAGDLKSVRTPIVNGTPTGNDFPLGKTTVYTYTTGFADKRLNHNLLTVTDPKGQTRLQNQYSATMDDSDPQFDRLTHQIWGNDGDRIDLQYTEVAPGSEPNGALRLAITNDREGNVGHFLFDHFNRLVVRRDQTGRADPDLPTTLTANLSKGKLRSTDPDWFEIRHSWNEDHLRTSINHPNGNLTTFVYERDLNPTGDRRSLGNLREVHRMPGTHTPSGDQAQIDEFFEYGGAMGGGGGTNFVTRHQDGEGNVTLHDYDLAGNRTKITFPIPSIVETFEHNAFGQLTAHVHPDNGSGYLRRDEFSYYGPADGALTGYPKDSVVDALGLALTRTSVPDSLGRVIRRTDGLGNDELLDWNALDQIVRKTSREVTTGSGVRFVTDIHFGPNDNVVKVERDNKDETGTPYAGNPKLTTLFEFDILDCETRRSVEKSASSSDVVVDKFYDGNRDLRLLRKGAATSGSDPNNEIAFVRDERRLLFQRILAPGHEDQSTTQGDYDFNGNLVTLIQGLEGPSQISTIERDGFNRIVARTDAMANRTEKTYDATGLVVKQILKGELNDVPGAAGNVRLAEVAFAHDAMRRRIRRETEFFDPLTQQSIGDGLSVRQRVWTDASMLQRQIDDNGHTVHFVYDGALRALSHTDAKGNSVTYVRNANGMVVQVQELEKSDMGMPDELFLTSIFRDGLDRSIQTVDNAGNKTSTGWDSMDNPVLTIDAKGNPTRRVFDGLKRHVGTSVDLTDTGTGQGTVVDQINTSTLFDDSSRVIRRVDDNQNVTAFSLDPLDRVTSIQYADGTVDSVSYDVHGNAVAMLDANGTSYIQKHDRNNRIRLRSVKTFGMGVARDTTGEAFDFDGTGSLVRAADDDSLITRAYDSMRNLTRETLNGATTRASHDGERNKLRCIYPGGRQIEISVDELNRPAVIFEKGAPPIAVYAYHGPWRVEQRTFPKASPAATVDTHYDYDDARRVTRIQHIAGSDGQGIPIVDRVFDWDPNFCKTTSAGQLPGDWSHTYSYGSAHRLVNSARSVPGSNPEFIDYVLDGADNRTAVMGGQDAGSYLMNPNSPPADAQMNQYTNTPFDDRLYDKKGNLSQILAGDVKNLTFDFQDQLVSVRDGAGAPIADYSYDALGRRTQTMVAGDPASIVQFFYEDSWVIEEQDAGGGTLATYVHGLHHEILQMSRGAGSFFYHADDAGSIMALTDLSGVPVARWEYLDFGQPVLVSQTTVVNPYLFAGLRFDLETGFCFDGRRFMDPRSGRHVSRAPGGMSGPAGWLRGNATTFAAANPWSPSCFGSGRSSSGKTTPRSGVPEIAESGTDVGTMEQPDPVESHPQPVATKDENGNWVGNFWTGWVGIGRALLPRGFDPEEYADWLMSKDLVFEVNKEAEDGGDEDGGDGEDGDGDGEDGDGQEDGKTDDKNDECFPIEEDIDPWESPLF